MWCQDSYMVLYLGITLAQWIDGSKDSKWSDFQSRLYQTGKQQSGFSFCCSFSIYIAGLWVFPSPVLKVPFHLIDLQGAALALLLFSLLWPSPFQFLFILSDSVSVLYILMLFPCFASVLSDYRMGADSFEACFLYGSLLCHHFSLLYCTVAPSALGMEHLCPPDALQICRQPWTAHTCLQSDSI